jgi:hypothetical protein
VWRRDLRYILRLQNRSLILRREPKSMADEEPTPAPRRRGRPPGSGARSSSTSRRRRQGGAELVETLNDMVNQLIRENRQLKRQLERLATAGTSSAGGTVERGLRSLQRRVQRAVSGTTGTRRRRAASSSASTSSGGGTRRRSSRSTQSARSTRSTRSSRRTPPSE